MDNLSIGERIHKSRKFLRLSQLEVSNVIGVFANVMSKIESGNREFKSQQIYKYCDEFGINPNWLIMGTGQMLKNQIADSPGNVASEPSAGYKSNNLIQLDYSSLEKKIAEMDEAIKQLESKMTT